MISTTSKKIYYCLTEEIPTYWDGRSCILELKGLDYQWRQMEWIGFYFEWKAKEVLKADLGGKDGPTFGNVDFDYELDGVWDFKVHPLQSSKWVYLNDVEAVNECLLKRGHLGWVLAVGDAIYDDTGEFKDWHDNLKGKRTPYEVKRIKRGAQSRKRKVAFKVNKIIILEFFSLQEIFRAIEEGWLRDDMQKNQRNSNGNLRRAKYGLNIETLPNICF